MSAQTQPPKRPRGRPPGAEPSHRMRVPESQVPAVMAYLEAHREPATAHDPRSITPEPTSAPLVAFAHAVPGGFPSPADDYLDDAIDLNRELIAQGHEAATFILRVKGWSMMQAGIHDGDRIVVDRALTAQQGDIVVAIVNNDLTVKRLGTLNGKLALLPENAHFPPITFEEGDTLQIWGVVTNCLRNFRRGGR